MTDTSKTQAQVLLEWQSLTKELADNWKSERLRIEESLKYLVTYTIKKDYEELNNTIAEKIRVGKIQRNQKSSHWPIDEHQSQTAPEQKSILIALTYLLMSQNEHQQGLTSSAWNLICRASNAEGYASGLIMPRINEGARGRTRKSQENQKKMAALIRSKRPDGGWIKERDAANHIYEDAINLNKTENMKLTEPQLTNLLTKWMKEESSACRAAFLGTNE
jgi:hypothetical protein